MNLEFTPEEQAFRDEVRAFIAENQARKEERAALEQAASELRIAVRDTGSGIAPEDLARVTEPFFSTKTNSEGLGLGLAISQAILAEFGGRFEICSTQGTGTVMTAILPRYQEGAI